MADSNQDQLMKLLGTIAGTAAVANPVTSVLGAATSLIPAAFGAYNAISMNKKANELEKNNKLPEFNFSPEVRKNQALAANAFAQKGLPGEDRLKTMIDEQIASTLTNTKGLTSSADVAGLLGTIGSQQIDTLGNIAIQGAQQDQQDLQTLMGANQEANQEFLRGEDYKMQKYLRDAAAVSAYRGATKESISNVLGDLSNVGLSYISNNKGKSDTFNINTPDVTTKGIFDVQTTGVDTDILGLLTKMRNKRFGGQ